MTLTELRALVAENLGQPLEAQSRLSPERVERAVNDGYVRFALDARCFRRTATLPVTQGRATLPVDMVEPVMVWLGTTMLTPASAAMLDLEQPGWRAQAAGMPAYWLRADATTVQVTPVPLAGGSVTVLGEVTPSDVADGIPLLTAEDAPALPYPYQEAPALWATWKLAAYLFPDDPVATSSGQVALAQYRELVNGLRGGMVEGGAYR